MQCMPAHSAAALVASSRRRTAFWPGDDDYRYVFHDILPHAGVGPGDANAALRRMIHGDFPLDALSALFRVDLRGKLRVNNFFLGARGTGTALHVHSAAINALAAGGPKLWVTAAQEDMDAMEPFQYGRVTNQSMEDWVLTNLDYFAEAVPGLAIFAQREGDVVYLPHFTFHATLNLGYNVGSAFSWYCDGEADTRVRNRRECIDLEPRGRDVLRAQAEAMKDCIRAKICRKAREDCGCQ